MRQQVANWIERDEVQQGILWVILINAIALGLETSPTVMSVLGPVVEVIDTVCLGIFVAEMALKLFAFRLSYFRSGWNLFDGAVILLALLPGTQSLTALRALRILRLFRVMTVAPSLRRVVAGLVMAIPGMASVFLLLGMIFYIGAVIVTKLFGANFDEWFGTVGRSAYSLFQIMTLESWSMGIVRPVMEEYPYAWAFFVPFIMMTSFAVVNLLVGLVVNSLQEAATSEAAGAADATRDDILDRLAGIEARLDRALDAAPPQSREAVTGPVGPEP